MDNATCEIYLLPCEAWTSRIGGALGNELADRNPEKAHAMLTVNNDGSYMVSVHAPLNYRTGANEVCLQFAAPVSVNCLSMK